MYESSSHVRGVPQVQNTITPKTNTLIRVLSIKVRDRPVLPQTSQNSVDFSHSKSYFHIYFLEKFLYIHILAIKFSKALVTTCSGKNCKMCSLKGDNIIQ